MNSRQRFQETMAYGQPDRPPCFEEGIRDDVIHAWRQQGMPDGKTPYELFDIDRRIEIMLN